MDKDTPGSENRFPALILSRNKEAPGWVPPCAYFTWKYITLSAGRVTSTPPLWQYQS